MTVVCFFPANPSSRMMRQSRLHNLAGRRTPDEDKVALLIGGNNGGGGRQAQEGRRRFFFSNTSIDQTGKVHSSSPSIISCTTLIHNRRRSPRNIIINLHLPLRISKPIANFYSPLDIRTASSPRSDSLCGSASFIVLPHRRRKADCTAFGRVRRIVQCGRYRGGMDAA